MQTGKMILSVLLSVLLVALTAPLAFADAPTVKTVSYIDENGKAQTAQATVLVPGAQVYGAAGETNWYVIEGTYSGGDVVQTLDASSNIIIADDADWTMTNTDTFNLFSVSGSLNLYAQKNGAGTLTLSNRIASTAADTAIRGGNITAPAIMASTSGGTVSVSGGVIRTDAFYCKNMTVSGGEIHTQSTMGCYGNLTVSGGELEVLQPNSGSMALICQGDLLITGGKITSDGMYGLYSSGGSVTITGGEVTATGKSMGISGNKGICISGGSVTATGTNSMGLFSGGPIEITGGTLSASGGVFGVYPSAQDAVVTLGADAPDSSYTFSSFLPGCTVAVKEGQTLTDGENDYSGALTADQVGVLAGKTLTCKHVYDDQSWTYFDGSRHMRVCEICGAPEYEAHDVIVKGAGDATCGDEGYTGDEFCSVCGQRLSEGEIIPPTGNHVTELVGAKDATATEDGYTGDTVCTVCGATVAEGEIIPATGTDEPDTPDTPDEPDEPTAGAKHHGEYCVCDGITGDGLFAWIMRLFCAIRCFFLSMRDALGV